ncbi:hypothetical protein B6I21_08540 [candidate division KSB1 bacterium 4572_119]|nr:MAG: hypothetical protein B6I21_08540 [candidate division KSB1 bacterium 4572_119]
MKSIFKSMSKQLFLLVVILGTLLFIMAIVKSDFVDLKPPAIPTFNENEKIIGNKYFNKDYNFGISIPSTDWEIIHGKGLLELEFVHFNSALLKNLILKARMTRSDNSSQFAIIDVAIMDLENSTTPTTIAKKSLNELKAIYSGSDSVYVTQGVISSGEGSLSGAFYMAELPEDIGIEFPVIIPMFFVRNNIAYAVICRSKVDNYDFVRHDFESVLTSFKLFE